MFTDKVAVITGAGSGIGRALAIQMAQAGARVALSDINRAGLDETLRLLPGSKGSGLRAKGYMLDVSSWEAVSAHAEEVKRDFGAVHILINNAGATVVGTVANTSVEEFEWLLGINLSGTLYGTKAFLPAMLEQREGCIVNISSIFGLISYPCQSAYNISKFAVRALSECLWSELEGTGVHALCVHPGGIRTNIENDSRRCKAAGALEDTFSAKAAKLLTTPPEVCAADIINGIRKRKRRVHSGNLSRTIFWMSRLFPNSYPAFLKLMG